MSTESREVAIRMASLAVQIKNSACEQGKAEGLSPGQTLDALCVAIGVMIGEYAKAGTMHEILPGVSSRIAEVAAEIVKDKNGRSK